MFIRLLKEPLLHFMILAAGLFIVHKAVSHEDMQALDDKRIVVDRAALLTFIQYRTKVFEPKVAAARLDALSGEALQRVIDDYVREEAMHREARALGLDRDDYVIKRRLIQKIDFVAQGFAEVYGDPSEEELASFFAAHKSEYLIEPSITFTHVFFDAKAHGRDKSEALARAELEKLNAAKAGFTEASRHGERFLYGMNYVERTEQYVRSHFGEAMTSTLFALPAHENRWQGPLLSPYGAHLVMVTARRAGRTPTLAEVHEKVLQDARRARIREKANEAVQHIVDSYEVRMDFEPAERERLARAQGE